MPDDELAGMVPTEAGGGVSHATPPPDLDSALKADVSNHGNYKKRGDHHQKMLSAVEDASPDFREKEEKNLQVIVQQLAAQQAQLQEMMAQQNDEMARLRQHNDQLQAELNGAKDRKANALQHHQAPAMTEDQRWSAMHSEGGLLG